MHAPYAFSLILVENSIIMHGIILYVHAADDHNYNDNNSIHERPFQDLGFFSVAHIAS